MSISRWDPLNDIVTLREAMNNLLEESFVRPRGAAPGTPAGLAVDVRETGDSFVVTASIPGVPAEDVDITVLGDTLRIRGERHDDTTTESGGGGGRWLVRERRFGQFERTISLPSAVKSGAATAEFNNGVLTITLPKAEEAKPRSIPVRSGGTQTPAEQPQEIEVQGHATNQRQTPSQSQASGDSQPSGQSQSSS